MRTIDISITEINNLTPKELLNKIFELNTHSKVLTDKYTIVSQTIPYNDIVNQDAETIINKLKDEGYTVKSKNYTCFTSIKAIKLKA